MWAKASFSAFDAPIEVTCETKGKPIGDYEIGVFDPHTGEPKTVGEYRRLLWFRAEGRPWRKLARHFGCGRRQVKQRWRNGVVSLWERLL